MRITRAGVYLKSALVKCSLAAVKSTAAPYYKNKFERITKRRCKKSYYHHYKDGLTAVYQMLSAGEIWNPCDLYKIDMPQEMRDKQKAKTIKQAPKLLISGRMISPESAPTVM